MSTADPGTTPPGSSPVDDGTRADEGADLAGLTEMMGTRHPRKVVMTRKNGRDCPNEACYYASL